MKKLMILAAAGTILAASDASAAGFLLREQSVAGMGNAFAGATAAAEDVSYSFYNPAAIIRFPGNQVSVNSTSIVGDVKGYGATGYGPYGNEIGYTPEMKHVVNKIILPSVSASKALDSRNSIGMSLNAPFGLVTDYSNMWAGANHGTLSELSVYDLTAMYAHRATCDLTVGVGVFAQYVDATLKNGVLRGTPFANSSTMSGDATDMGWIVGALYEYTADTRIGVAYRSQVNHKLAGKVSFAGQNYRMGLFNQDITAKLTTPAMLTMGIYHDIDSKWAVMAEAQKTYWSSFDDLTIKGQYSIKPLSVTDEDWKDAWFYSIGASYQVNEEWKLRFGLAFDQTPVSINTRTPRIPDSDRIWYSTGFEYKYTDALTLNAGYSYIRAEKSKVRLLGIGNDATRGAMQATYKGNIHLFGLGLVYNF